MLPSRPLDPLKCVILPIPTLWLRRSSRPPFTHPLTLFRYATSGIVGILRRILEPIKTCPGQGSDYPRLADIGSKTGVLSSLQRFSTPRPSDYSGSRRPHQFDDVSRRPCFTACPARIRRGESCPCDRRDPSADRCRAPRPIGRIGRIEVSDGAPRWCPSRAPCCSKRELQRQESIASVAKATRSLRTNAIAERTGMATDRARLIDRDNIRPTAANETSTQAQSG